MKGTLSINNLMQVYNAFSENKYSQLTPYLYGEAFLCSQTHNR